MASCTMSKSASRSKASFAQHLSGPYNGTDELDNNDVSRACPAMQIVVSTLGRHCYREVLDQVSFLEISSSSFRPLHCCNSRCDGDML